MPHVLIIDDDVSQSAALAALLRHKGHVAEYASSAGQALTRLREVEPDLVLLDLSMPRVDGLDLLDALTADPRYDNLRIAVYSGRAEPDAFAAAKRLGACDYIVKGDDAGQMVARILSNLEATPPAEGSDGPLPVAEPYRLTNRLQSPA